MSVTICATYRIQLNPDFNFEDAAKVVEYLSELGISHVYCSPYLQAAPGSTHGYDVVNPRKVNEELGGENAHKQFSKTIKKNKMGQILDIVPNHMAITGPENPWWWDVLENGPSSRYASYFDVDWDPPESRHSNLVLVPVLGDHYGRVLEAYELKLEHFLSVFTIHYYDHMFPVSPRTLDELLFKAAERCESDELAFIADSFAKLPLPTATDRESVQKRHRNKEVLQAHLARLCKEKSEVNAAIDAVVAEINTNPDALDKLLRRQNYRLAFWRMAERDLGYRRFFDINTLAGLRMEDEQVFEDTHVLILEWLGNGLLDGLRVDHPDGLRDPEKYFRRLRHHRPDAWIVVEKILEEDESLRKSWPVDGTTGYDFLNRVNGLFVDPDGENPMNKIYEAFTGESTDYQTVMHEKKHLVMEEVLGSDVNRLTALLVMICECHRRHRDYPRNDLHDALCELIDCFPVYRTYVREDSEQVTEQDKEYITTSIETAKANRSDIDPNLFDFLQELLLLRVQGDVETEFAMRFQQFTGPVMAKGVEDTTFYCYNRLVSLNEVGGNPGKFGISVEEFHQSCQETLQHWPQTMITTSTHDTKRSEDVRARIDLLSEIPGQWSDAVNRWSKMTRGYRQNDYPDRNTEYLLYQTLVGAWPIGIERLTEYMKKAVREAKAHTSWTDPNEVYEETLCTFIENIMNDTRFIADLKKFVTPLIHAGRINSLSQTLIKLTAPGIPDIYQGTELWNLSLVDPDNRRSVDYECRRKLLNELNALPPKTLLSRMDEGLPKMWVIRQTLALRNENPEIFGAKGDYQPIFADGDYSDNIVAFSRGNRAITITPRLTMNFDDWKETTLKLPEGTWLHQFTNENFEGGTVKISNLFAKFPVCLLWKEKQNQ